MPGASRTASAGPAGNRTARTAGSPVGVVLTPARLGKAENLGQIAPAESSFRVDAEALSGRMHLRRGRVVAGDEEDMAGLLRADRHLRKRSPGRRGQAQPPRGSLIVRLRT